MRFRVLQGIHSEGGDIYKKGEVFESDTDHVEVNGPEKFEQVSSTTKLSPKGDHTKKPLTVSTEGKATEDMESPEGKGTDAAIAAAKSNQEEEDDSDVETDNSGEDDSESTKSKLGKDVTEDFASAKEGDLKVFKKGKEYFVTEMDQPDEPINTAHLKTKPQVEKFIKSQIK